MNSAFRWVQLLGIGLLALSVSFGLTGCGGEEEDDLTHLGGSGGEASSDEGGEASSDEGGDEASSDEGGGDAAFAAIYEAAGFSGCGNCHSPDAPGNVDGTEKTQDWSDADSAYAALQGVASGLVGNFEGCNGVPFIGDSVETSLIVATLDEEVRDNFVHPDFPDCTGDTISDMTLKTPGFSDDDLDALKAWIAAGAPE